jgi:hypothetical protein
VAREVESRRHAMLGVMMNQKEGGLLEHASIIAHIEGNRQGVFRYVGNTPSSFKALNIRNLLNATAV